MMAKSRHRQIKMDSSLAYNHRPSSMMATDLKRSKKMGIFSLKNF